MPFLREVLSRLLHLDNHRLARLGWARPLQLVTYRTYGTAGRFYVKGRLLTDPGLAPATVADSRWHNFRNMARRFLSYEIAGAELVAERAGGAPQSVMTDDEGYFTLVLEAPPQPPGALLWQPVAVRLAQLPGGAALPARPPQAVAEVLVPPAGAEFGVISDLDDTVFESGATNFLRMSFTVLLRNALSHQPFAGVGEFYRALQLGCTGQPDNPFFYISSSPWNLYDALDEFLTLHRIPKGPLLLRDVGLRPRTPPVPPTAEGLAAAAHFGHKLHEIEDVLRAYPHLPFVLLGDSGQEDVGIYREVVRRYPGRVRAVYIRDVQVPKRTLRIPGVAAELRAEGVDLLLVPDYATAMRHAASLGLITDGAVIVDHVK